MTSQHRSEEDAPRKDITKDVDEPRREKNTILVLEAKEAKTAKFVSIRSDGNVPAKHPIRTLRVLAGKFFLL